MNNSSTLTSSTPGGIAHEIRMRIIDAANELYEQSNRDSMPTVDAVRKAARVDMNSASTVMREWRRAQTTQAVPLTVQVPSTVLQASQQAVAALWSQAQELANESLRLAQAAWETERLELDSMRVELANAYESQALEFTNTQAIAAKAQELAAEATAKTAKNLDESTIALANASSRADRAEARTSEIELRAEDLRLQLQKAQAVIVQFTAERENQAHQLKEMTSRIDNARFEKMNAEVKAEQIEELLGAKLEASERRANDSESRAAKADAVHQAHSQVAAAELKKITDQRDEMQRSASSAREEAAQLRGNIDVLKDQLEKATATVKANADKSAAAA